MLNWRPTGDDFDGPVPTALLDDIRDWTVQLRPGERVECVAVATEPQVVLLVMTDTDLNRAYVAGIYHSDGVGRLSLWGRMQGDRLIVSETPLGPGDEYGGVMPAGSAERIAAELHKPYRADDGSEGNSAADLRW